MTYEDLFLETASRIGSRIVKEAVWDGRSCTWQVLTTDASKPKSHNPVRVTAPGTVYQGTAGIGIFLAELYAANPREEFKRCAEGAVNHAIAQALKLPNNSFGYHSGRVGIAYAAARLGALLEDEKRFIDANDVLEPLEGQEKLDFGIDVIGGSAGAIAVLLELSQVLSKPALAMVAEKLGDHLIRIARKEPFGWCWGAKKPIAVRCLNGLAHGASGEGYALLELFNATGRGKYLYAAEQAFLYERQFYDNEAWNWPDFRHSELGDYFYSNRQDELRDLVRKGLLPPYKRQFMTAWCHGSPGIGLTRLRAFELLRRGIYEDESRKAIDSTIASLENQHSNYSLCHGLAGNCETLMYGSRVLSDRMLRERCNVCAVEGWERFEKQGKAWPCGTPSSVPDPSLMLGEAGIGLFYLRLRSDWVPSILFPIERSRVDSVVDLASYHELRNEYLNGFFGSTISAMKSLKVRGVDYNAIDVLPRTDVADFYQSIKNAISLSLEPTRSLLDDASRVERLRFDLAESNNDLTEEYLNGLKRVPFQDVDYSGVAFVLSSSARLASTRLDWKKWDRRDEDVTLELPEQEERHFLIFRLDNRVQVRELDAFAAAVLKSVLRPRTLDEIVSNVQDIVEVSSPRHLEELRLKVIAQLQEVYTASVVVTREASHGTGILHEGSEALV